MKQNIFKNNTQNRITFCAKQLRSLYLLGISCLSCGFKLRSSVYKNFIPPSLFYIDSERKKFAKDCSCLNNSQLRYRYCPY